MFKNEFDSGSRTAAADKRSGTAARGRYIVGLHQHCCRQDEN